jgi:hypothetical protein
LPSTPLIAAAYALTKDRYCHSFEVPADGALVGLRARPGAAGSATSWGQAGMRLQLTPDVASVPIDLDAPRSASALNVEPVPWSTTASFLMRAYSADGGLDLGLEREGAVWVQARDLNALADKLRSKGMNTVGNAQNYFSTCIVGLN